MKRLLMFVPILLCTMAVGPCDPQPLGSVDAGVGSGCDYRGARHGFGSTFPSSDGCNTCSCDPVSGVACTLIACDVDAGATLDGGSTPDSGSATTCIYEGTAREVGSSFPSSDGCNTCTCDPTLGVACTLRACAPDAAADAPATCTYLGASHPIDSTFPSGDGCNTCTCNADGSIPCTLRACAGDAGTDGAGATACTPGHDETCNEDPAISSIRGACNADGTCSCPGLTRSPYTGKCLNPGDTSGNGCEYQGVLYPPAPDGSSSFYCFSSCAPCYCVSPGKILMPTASCSGPSTGI